MPKNFVENHFCVGQKIWYRNKLAIREGASITIFRQIVLSHSSESSRRGMLLCFRKFGVSKKLMLKRGTSRFVIENLLSHCTEKLRSGTLLCFTKILVSKKISVKRGVEYRDFPAFCFVSQYQIIS